MITLQLIIYFLVLSDNSFKKQPYTVLAESGMNLRAQPNIRSKVVDKLVFGTVIYTQYERHSELKNKYKKDTINGVIGYWVDAELRNRDLNGYLFSPYIYPGELVNYEINEATIRLTKEGVACGDFDYHPNLNYYGVYNRNNKYYIEKVELTLILSKVDSLDEFQNELTPGGYNGWKLKTDREEQSRFLIGSYKKLESGEINTVFIAQVLGINPHSKNGFLYPEQKIKFDFASKKYVINGKETIELDTSTLKINKNYTVKCSIVERSGIKSKTYDFGPELDLCCDANRHSLYQTPQVYLLGDFNSDNNLDVLFYQHTMSEGCGMSWTYSLFLGNPSNDNKMFQLVDQLLVWSCI